jgi:hypothetical protein
METERMALSQRERDCIRVLHEVKQGHLTQVEAAKRMHLCEREVRRLRSPPDLAGSVLNCRAMCSVAGHSDPAMGFPLLAVFIASS